MHRKKTISWILSVVTVLSVFFLNFGSITVNAVNKSADDAINWCKSLLGHAIDVDKCYGAQCVDLIMAYYDYLVGYHVSGNGEDYASNKYPSEDGWTRTQGGTPQKGDILVYVDNSTYVENGVTKQRVGHVAIYESDYSTYHQNYNGQYVRNITNTIYSKACRATAYYWGCIHPNFNGSTVSPTPVSSWYDMPDGEYEIFSKSTGKALNAFCNNGQARQGTKITVAPSSHSVDQKFKIEGLDTQKHYIRCLSNSNLFYLDVYADNVYSGAEAHLWSYSSNPTKQWYFKDEGNGDFSIRCVSNSNLALTVTNEVPYNDQLRVRVQDWNGSDAQKWRLEGNVPRPSYQLDLNSYVDGEKKWDLAGVATADVYINGTLVADDCNDFCATYVEGTRYKIVISTKAGYNIVDKTSYEGSLTGPINIEPSFVKILYPLDLNSYIDGVERDCLGGVATADVYINGNLVADDCDDYCVYHVPGTTFKIVITVKDGYVNKSESTYQGTLDKGYWISPRLEKAPHEHAWSYNESASTPATCKSEGIKSYSCSGCSEIKTERIPIDPNNHINLEIRNVKEATQLEAGYTGDTYCADCNKLIEKGSEIPPLHTHTWDDGEILLTATCTKEGIICYTCTGCGGNRVESIPVDPDTHINTEIRGAKDADQSEEGYTGDEYCLDCGKLVKQGEIIPLLHTHIWEQTEETIEMTCVADGVLTYKCTDCDETRVEIIPSDPEHHVHTEIRNAEAETYSANGYTGDVYCVDCGKLIAKGEVIPKLSDPVLKIDSVRVTRDYEIRVAVSIKNNPGFTSMAFDIDYDSSVLQLINVEDSGIIPGDLSYKESFSAPYRLAWVNETAEENYTENGIITVLTFRCAGNAPFGDYYLRINSLDCKDMKEQDVSLSIQNGLISIADVIYGDVDGNGKVDMADVQILAKYLAGWTFYEIINEAAADVDNDGDVDMADVQILAKHLAGWTGYEALPHMKFNEVN